MNERVMLLIDADNVSVDVMEQAVRMVLKQHGALHVRRAYCTAESAVKHQAAFKRLSIKPMVNLAAGKNSTDIALAVDAMDLVLAERPDVVVIASSDSDFAPLVQRLREKGCVLRGMGQSGKTGSETQDVYDDFTVLEHQKASSRRPKAEDQAQPTTVADVPRKVAKRPARKSAAASTTAAVSEQSPKSTPKSTPESPSGSTPDMSAERLPAGAPAVDDVATLASVEPPAAAKRAAPARKRTAAKKTTAASVAPAPTPAPLPSPAPEKPAAAVTSVAKQQAAKTVNAVLACLPELAGGHGLALNVAVQRLREAKLLGKHASSLKLFSSFSEVFELLPANNPAQVRLRR